MDEEIIVDGDLYQAYNSNDGPRAYTFTVVRITPPPEEEIRNLNEDNDDIE